MRFRQKINNTQTQLIYSMTNVQGVLLRCEPIPKLGCQQHRRPNHRQALPSGEHSRPANTATRPTIADRRSAPMEGRTVDDSNDDDDGDGDL